MTANREAISGISLAEYVAALSDDGATVVPGADGTYWRSAERLSLERLPTRCLDEPSQDEVRNALRRTRTAVATYNRHADASHPQNAWLYLCQNQDYRVENLESAARRDVRRALREFRFEMVDISRLLQDGAAAFCETRSRLGLSDGVPEAFQKHFRRFLDKPDSQIIAAWRDGEESGPCLAAFMSVSIVERWVTIAAYSRTAYLRYCPNNGLLHYAMEHFLTQHKLQGLDYGLSSIQEVGKADTLHRFKVRMGFEAIPVHRAFVFHPLLRPLVNPLTLWGLRTCARVHPSSRRLRKAAGLLAAHLGRHEPPTTHHGDQHDTGNAHDGPAKHE
ncbi:MAG: hypothetical protein LLG00_06680 [Planctomycetaceae bacterium]|nr:hypothetical protein [Planctomycetaceae bacterium]